MSFLLFLLSGGISTLLDVAFFQLLRHIVDASVAYVLSYASCVALRYWFDSKLTFRARARTLGNFGLYLLTNLFVMLLGLLAFRIAALYLPPLAAKIASIPVTIAAGFLLVRALVFSKPPAAEPACDKTPPP